MARLDRSLINKDWFLQYAYSYFDYGIQGLSDHYHYSYMIVRTEKDIVQGPKPFQFFSMWTYHPDFMSIVQRAWDFEGSSIFYLIFIFFFTMPKAHVLD